MKKLVRILFLISTFIFFATTQAETPDFEDVNATVSGNVTYIGASPNLVTLVNFTLKTVDDPALVHSGTKALVLNPGATYGQIIFERGVNDLKFYAADTQGGGRIELRDKNLAVLATQAVVDGLPNNISVDSNPLQQSFIAYGGNFADTSDLNYTNGIKELKITNPVGQVSIDDLSYTYVEGPPNNTVFEDFADLSNHPIFKSFANRVNFTIGESPYTATFTKGIVTEIHGVGIGRIYNHTYPLSPVTAGVAVSSLGASWQVPDKVTGIITFEETPAAKVEFYAAVVEAGAGEIQVFDTEDNLIASDKNIALAMSIEVDVPFAFHSFDAAELGAPEGIGKVTYINTCFF